MKQPNRIRRSRGSSLLLATMALAASIPGLSRAGTPQFDALLVSLEKPDGPIPADVGSEEQVQFEVHPERVRLEVRDKVINTLELYLDGNRAKSITGPLLRSADYLERIKNRYQAVLKKAHQDGTKVVITFTNKNHLTEVPLISRSTTSVFDHDAVVKALLHLFEENERLKAQKN